MNTIDSSFELIMQELMNQKQILEDLEAENLDLRRQLADLRAGRGIVVDILGERFSLNVEPDASAAPSESPSTEQAVAAVDSSATSNVEASTTPIPETLLTDSDQEESEEETAVPAATAPAFLEEMLLEEFATASTRQMAVWTNSAPKPPVVDEEEKAVLRRELSDSFLLE